MKDFFKAVGAIILMSALSLGGWFGVMMGMESAIILPIGIAVLALFGKLWAGWNLMTSKRSGIKTLVWLLMIIFFPGGFIFYYYIGAK